MQVSVADVMVVCSQTVTNRLWHSYHTHIQNHFGCECGMNKEGVVGTHAGPVDCREKNTLIVVLEFLLRTLIMPIPFYLSFLVPSLHLCFNESVYV